MSELTHTAEPWSTAYRERRDGQYAQEIFDASGELIATLAWYSVREGSSIHTNREENARRIIACVNAIKGIPTEYLEAHGLDDVGETVQALDRALRERDEAIESMAAMGLRIVELQAQLEVSAMEATRQAVAATTAVKERDELRAMVAELASIVRDHGDHDEWLDEHGLLETDYDPPEENVTCPKCYHIWPGSPDTCITCGEALHV